MGHRRSNVSACPKGNHRYGDSSRFIASGVWNFVRDFMFRNQKGLKVDQEESDPQIQGIEPG